MSETIEKLRFLKKLESMFSEEFDSVRHYGSYSEEEYILLFFQNSKKILIQIKSIGDHQFQTSYIQDVLLLIDLMHLRRLFMKEKDRSIFLIF